MTFGQNGRLAVVNMLNAERLLEGVVPAEQYNSAPMETLKAQAIASRGQLLVKAGLRHRGDPYLFCDQVHCQGYSGINNLSPRTSRAVIETKGLLAVNEHGRLIDTVYSSTCGGHSEAYHLMWGGAVQPALKGQADSSAHRAFWLQGPKGPKCPKGPRALGALGAPGDLGPQGPP